MSTLGRLRRRVSLAVKGLMGRTVRSALQLSDAHLLALLALPDEPAGRSPDRDRLLQHFDRRARSEHLVFPHHISKECSLDATDLLARAQDITRRRFEYANQAPVQFDAEVDWAFDPTDDPRKRWARALSRHHWMALLVAAYQRTQDDTFVAAFAELTTSWIQANPPPPERDETSVGWNLMNVGIRCMIWPVAFLAFQPSPRFPASTRLLMLRSMLDHGRFLCRFRTHGNHLLRESNGLANLAGWFPEFREAQSWRHTALTRLETEFVGQINADGSHYELSTAYQWMVIEEFEATREVLDRFGWWLPAVDLDEGLGRLYAWLVQTRAPGGTWPQLNDGFFDPWSHYAERLATATGYLPSPPEPSVQPQRSVHLPDSGVAVMRSGLRAGQGGEHYLLVKAGPYGGLHGHEDKLSFELHLGDRPMLVDPGTYTYNAADPFRSYFVSSQAHNTITVDGRSQVRRFQAVHRTPSRSHGHHGDWLSHPAFDLFSAGYEDGYADFRFYPRDEDLASVDRSVRHVRTILYVRGHYWIVIDDLFAQGTHEYARHFQCAAGVVPRIVNQRVLLDADGAVGLWLVAAEPDTRILTASGATDPIGGWVSDGRLGHKMAAAQLALRDRCSGPTRLVTLLLPQPLASPGDAEPPTLTIEGPLASDPDPLTICVGTADWSDRLQLSGYRSCAAAGVRIERQAPGHGTHLLAAVEAQG